MKIQYVGNDPHGVVVPGVYDDKGEEVLFVPGEAVEVESEIGNSLLEQATWKRPSAKSGETSHPTKKEGS